MFRLIWSLAKSIGSAVRQDPELNRLVRSHPRVWTFLRARFDRSAPFGLRLTIGAAVSLYLMYLFAGVAQDLMSSDPLVSADLRLISLVQMLRSPAVNSVMLFITYLGSWQIVVLGAILLGVVFAFFRLRLWLVALWVSIGGGELIVWSLKNLFDRPRPDLVNALLPAAGPSFPSGHAFVAVSFYGLVAWFGIRWARKRRARVIILTAALLIIIALGFSRIYLGVHWPSDVLASYALGGAWLAVVITALSIGDARLVADQSRRRPMLSPMVAAVLFLGWASLLVAYYETHPFPPPALPAPLTPVVLAEAKFPSNLFDAAPLFSEDIIGAPMEPINVILVGSESDVAQAFKDASWSPTDSITFGTIAQLVIAELSNRPYPKAPGTPSFWNGRPNQRGFERPTSANSARERHHLHLWNTQFQVAGTPVWVGTVHLDTSAATSNGIRLPIHQIDPAVDVQREGLRSDLSASRCVTRLTEEPITEPTIGKNGAGNPFFTDGKSLVALVKCG